MQLLQQQAQQKEKTSPFEIKCLGSPVSQEENIVTEEMEETEDEVMEENTEEDMEEVIEIDEKDTDTEEKHILSLSYDLSDSVC